MPQQQIIDAQLFIIQGYYNKIVLDKLSVCDILNMLEADRAFLQGEQNVLAASSFINNYDPHEVSTVKCDLCSLKWVAVRPEGVEKLENI